MQRVAPAFMRHRAPPGLTSSLAKGLALAGLDTGVIAARPTDSDETNADLIEAIDAFVTAQIRELHLPGLVPALWDRTRPMCALGAWA